MRTHRSLVFTAAAVGLALAAGSVGAPQNFAVPDWEGSVRFRLLASQEPVRPGDRFELALEATIDPGYHLYGPEEAEPSATRLEIAPVEHLELGEPRFPDPVRRDLSGLGTYDLYEGRIAIRIPAKAKPTLPTTGRLPVTVTVYYQVCTDYACSAPTSRALTIELPLAAAGAAVEKRHPEIFAPAKETSSEGDEGTGA